MIVNLCALNPDTIIIESDDRFRGVLLEEIHSELLFPVGLIASEEGVLSR